MQQTLLIFGEKNTYTTLLGPTRLLISEIFPSKPDFHLHKWEKNPTYTTLLGPTRLSFSENFPSKPDFHLHKWEKVLPTQPY